MQSFILRLPFVLLLLVGASCASTKGQGRVADNSLTISPLSVGAADARAAPSSSSHPGQSAGASATATAPIDEVDSLSKTGVNVVPALVVLNSPPVP